MLTNLSTQLAMLVHVGVTLTFRRTGARKGNAGGELRFQELPVTDLVGPRQNAAGGGTNRSAILIEPYTGDQPLDMLFGETGIGAGRAGLDTGKARFDASADRIGMARLLRVRAEHGSDGNGGHEYLPSERACPITPLAVIGSGPEKVPNPFEFLKSSRCRHTHAVGNSLAEFLRCH
jgi:hypothetical protein